MPVKILYLITDLNFGGAEKQLSELVTRLDRTRFDPVVAGLKGWGHTARRLQKAGIEVHAGGGNLFSTWSTLQRLCDIHQPSIIHSFLFRANLIGRFLGKKSAPKPRVISSIRVWDERRLPLLIEGWTKNWSDCFVFNSQWVADQFCRATRLNAKQLRVIPNAIDPKPYTEARRRAQETRAGLEIDDAKFLILGIGRLDRQKGFPCLLQAFKEVLIRQPQARLLIAGDGPDRQSLQTQIKTLEISWAARLIGFRSDVPELLSACDCLALSSLWEGSPNVVLEAWAAGVPVVATAVGGTPELIQDQDTGLLTAPGNPRALADGLTRAIGDTPLRSRLISNAARRLSAHSNERIVRLNQDLYQELIAH
ncbi:MAG: glycosyltransferase [Elusimicrobiota bacterium]